MAARNSYAQTQIPTGKADTPYLDSTKLVMGLLKRMSESQGGSVTGTGAAIEIALDFDPAAVILFNRTAPCLAIKFPGMTTDTGMKLTGVPALTASAAICTLGTLGQKKFTIGTDADVNTAAEVIEWIAFGFSDKATGA